MKKRIFYYDFVRGFAFVFIIIYHFNISVVSRNISGTTILINDFCNNLDLGHIGVSLFFILSGSALMESSGKVFDIREFYKKRIKSLLPLFWTAYLLVFIYYFCKYKTGHPFTEEPKGWTFLLTVIGMDGYTASLMLNYYKIGEWFLGCILLMYMMFPALKWGVEKHPYTAWIPVIAVYCFLNYKYILPNLCTQDVFMRLPAFVFGMYMGKYIKKVRVIGLIPAVIILPVCACVDFSEYLSIPVMVYVTLAGVSSYTVFRFVGERAENELFKEIVAKISAITYPVYLLHHVISEQIITNFEQVKLSSVDVVVLFVIVLGAEILGGIGLQNLYNKISENVSKGIERINQTYNYADVSKTIE